jgi:hypothetical protein
MDRACSMSGGENKIKFSVWILNSSTTEIQSASKLLSGFVRLVIANPDNNLESRCTVHSVVFRNNQADGQHNL